jgi:hypothetical protein
LLRASGRFLPLPLRSRPRPDEQPDEQIALDAGPVRVGACHALPRPNRQDLPQDRPAALKDQVQFAPITALPSQGAGMRATAGAEQSTDAGRCRNGTVASEVRARSFKFDKDSRGQFHNGLSRGSHPLSLKVAPIFRQIPHRSLEFDNRRGCPTTELRREYPRAREVLVRIHESLRRLRPLLDFWSAL